MFRTRVGTSRSFKDRKRLDHQRFRLRKNEAKAALDLQLDRFPGTGKNRSLIETLRAAESVLSTVTII